MSQSPSIGEPTARFGLARQGFTARPVVTGRQGVVAAGHYLAAAAGARILQLGGNAIDAGVAMGFCSAVLEPHLDGIGGEVPILIHHAATGRTLAVSGQGTAPRAADIAWFKSHGIAMIPGDGLLPATVPSQVDTFLTSLEEFGTLPLEPVLTPALELARDGFAMYHGLRGCIQACAARFRAQWPGSVGVYLPGDQVPAWGDRFVNPELGEVLAGMIRAAQAAGGSARRSAGLAAARDYFYRGPVAEGIAGFCRDHRFDDATGTAHGGLLTYEDMGGYRARVEPAVRLDYAGLEVYKCGPWTQGPVFLQQLALLAGFDLPALGHNTADYLHTYAECAKLAFADREAWYGDPDFARVPLERLLARDYNDARRKLVDPQRASMLQRPGSLAAGNPGESATQGQSALTRGASPAANGETDLHRGDTTHVCAIDAHGNMIAATPSGGWIPSSPVIPGLGFCLGTRGQMFSLDASHPNSLRPGKRPRATLTPSLALREGKPYMAFGTPGGDAQDQWTLQFFLNLVHFGMGLQEALEAPLCHSEHFPSSFYPRTAFPGRLVIESRVPQSVTDELIRRGHQVVRAGDWTAGRVLAIRIDALRQLIFGGASPRGETAYVAGW